MTRSSHLAAASGLTSYAEIGDAFEEAATDPRVRGILLDIDSPGGEVGGLFDLVDRIRDVRAMMGGMPLWAVAHEAALSAAYAIASLADRLYVTQTGEVGSIGVVAVHVDESGADRQAGMQWTFVHAGAHKVDGNPHEPLSDRARADLQADVDRIYEQFVTLVQDNRAIPVAMVRTTEAAIYRGARAVQASLADQVGTLRDASDALVVALTRPPVAPAGRRHKTPQEKTRMSCCENEDREDDASATVDSTAQIEQRLRADYAEIAALAAQGARLGVVIDAARAMAEGIIPADLRRCLLDTLSQRVEASAVASSRRAPARAKAPSSSVPAQSRPVTDRRLRD